MFVLLNFAKITFWEPSPALRRMTSSKYSPLVAMYDFSKTLTYACHPCINCFMSTCFSKCFHHIQGGDSVWYSITSDTQHLIFNICTLPCSVASDRCPNKKITANASQSLLTKTDIYDIAVQPICPVWQNRHNFWTNDLIFKSFRN